MTDPRNEREAHSRWFESSPSKYLPPDTMPTPEPMEIKPEPGDEPKTLFYAVIGILLAAAAIIIGALLAGGRG